MTLALLFAISGFADNASSVLKDDVVFEHCGIACIYGILKLNGTTASLEEIESRVRALHPDAIMSRLTLAELRSTIETFGLCAASYRSDRNVAHIPTPCILYLRPDKVGGDGNGHVVILQAISPERARICDFTAGVGRRDVTIDQLLSFWDGELIAVSREPARYQSPSGRYITFTLIAFLALAAYYARLRLRRATTPQQISTAL